MLTHRGYLPVHSPPPRAPCFRFLKLSPKTRLDFWSLRDTESKLSCLAKNRFKSSQAGLDLLIGSLAFNLTL